MSLSLDELLSQAREYDMIVISETDPWPSPWVTPEVKNSLRPVIYGNQDHTDRPYPYLSRRKEAYIGVPTFLPSKIPAKR